MTTSAKQKYLITGAELFTVSMIVLFQELAFMRWLPGKIRVLAYFPNLILISSFLGLGVGCLIDSKNNFLKKIWFPTLLVMAILAEYASKIAFTQNSVSEHLWLLYYDLPKEAVVIENVTLPIIITFIFCAISFVGLGQIVASKFEWFKNNSKSLIGYCFDIAGSLFGIITFTTLSFVGTFPATWFAIFMCLGLWFFKSSKRDLVVNFIIAVLIFTFITIKETSLLYSPYYAISLKTIADDPKDGFHILTNGSLHQTAMSLKKSSLQNPITEDHVKIINGYHIPYSLMSTKPKRGLIIGAGSGNDVSTMLDEGVETIDAVEIDPKIIAIGKRWHPDNPYASPKVNIINTDARAFLNTTDKKYDFIVFGTLDSMTRLSALSNVRLDNFVYTEESITAAKKLLTPGGGMALYFMVGTDFIHLKIMGMLSKIFGESPLVVKDYHVLFNSLYMSGPLFAGHNHEERVNIAKNVALSNAAKLETPTDDWPFLYMKERGISSFYLTVAGLIIGISILSILSVSSIFSKISSNIWSIDFEMFFFGASFLLLETRSVTAMNLFWGATWLTSSIVFAAILFMVLLSTLMTLYKPLPFKISAVCLILSLGLTYLLPISGFVDQSFISKFLVSTLVVGVPVFFAGGCFSFIFESRTDTKSSFGWNLLGAVFGGLLEFLSLLVGLKAIILIAGISYLLAFYFMEKRNQRQLLI